MSLASKKLEEKGQALLDAAYEYWKAAHEEGISGAIIWLDDSDGKTLIFTRGEYRGHLLHNIDTMRQDVRTFTQHLNRGAEIDEGKNLSFE